MTRRKSLPPSLDDLAEVLRAHGYLVLAPQPAKLPVERTGHYVWRASQWDWRLWHGDKFSAVPKVGVLWGTLEGEE